MGRKEHEFSFAAAAIQQAANGKAQYHRTRADYWTSEMDGAILVVRATASVEVRQVAVTGGEQPQVVINYGDPGAHIRMVQAWSKKTEHQKLADRYEAEARVYGSQPPGREYLLTGDDVAYFGFDGVPGND